jgi:hypothetical protein
VGAPYTPVAVPPPSAAAALAFGRPGAGDAPQQFDAEAAMLEFRQRVAMRGAAPASPDWKAQARTVLREAARRSPLVSRTLGYGPARTAARLAEAARLSPTLSAASHRADLRSAMLERLSAFARTQRVVALDAVGPGA